MPVPAAVLLLPLSGGEQVFAATFLRKLPVKPFENVTVVTVVTVAGVDSVRQTT
jgi:hypothetical protein